MAVCKFYLSGSCKFGDRCRFEHPSGLNPNRDQGVFGRPPANQDRSGRPPQSQNQYGRSSHSHDQYGRLVQGQNRFGALADRVTDNAFNRQGNSSGRGPPPRGAEKYGLSRDTIEDDLTKERPQWIMSAYGPGRDSPIQLFGGYPLEQSFEEIRTLHCLAVAAGHAQHSAQNEVELANQANKQAQSVVNDLDGAIKYIIDGAETHPNRLDMCIAGSDGQRQRNNVFARGSQHAQQSLALSALQRPGINAGNGFQPQQGTAKSGFDPFSAPLQPLFQQTGMGAPSTGIYTPALNGLQAGNGVSQQTSSFGLPLQSTGANLFGGHHQNRTNGGFGEAQQVSAATTASAPPAAGVFGRPAVLPTNQFVSPPLSLQQNNLGTTADAQWAFSNGLGKGPAGASHGNPNGGFAMTTQQPLLPGPSVLSGQPAQQGPLNGISANQIDLAPSQAPPTHAFGSNPSQEPQVQIQPNTFLSGATTSDIKTYTTRNASNQLQTWKGHQVTLIEGVPCYRNPAHGYWERIWFPDGPAATNQPNEPEAANVLQGITYQEDEVKAAYEFVAQNGAFRDGIMPEVPPRQEWIRWDL